jgi:HD-like signal output (HDOD) protein
MTFTESRDESAWVRLLGQAEIPVLRHSALELARLQENEDRVVARDISRVLLHDPMFTLRVLRELQQRPNPGRSHEITTVVHALMMLGVAPFFERFRDLPVVETMLAGHPPAMQGLMRVLDRAHHAALYAQDWAGLRHDVETEEVMVAALLHDLAEMLLWCFAPELALRIAALQQADPQLRSGSAQRAVLGFTLADLQLALAAQWKLPALLLSLMDDAHADSPRVRNVLLAVNLARHAAGGWDNPALPDDHAAIARHLDLPLAQVVARVQVTAQQALAGRHWYRVEAPTQP